MRPRLRRTWAQRIAIAVGLLSTFAFIGAASAVGYVFWKTGSFARANVTLDKVETELSPRNYLLIGSDSRANIDKTDPNADLFLGDGVPGGQRSDTILLLRIDPVVGDVKMLSFPRDLWVPIADDGREAKINSAYGKGKQVLVDTIRKEFDVPVNNYIEVDFKGFKDLVQAIGGVRLYFPNPMKDDHTGLDVPAGCVSLDGDQGLAFARSRYTQYQRANGTWSDTDPIADLGRIKRQQVFVRKAMKKVASLNITDLFTLNSLLDVAVNSVTIDQTIDRGDLKSLADRFKSITDDQIKSYSLPVTTGSSPDGQSIVRYDKKAARSVLDIFRGKEAGAVVEPDVTVDVRNGTGVKNQGRDVLAAFGQVGFTTGRVGADVVPPQSTTTIRYATGDDLVADLVARHVTGPTRLVADPNQTPGRVELTTGADFTTLLLQPRAATTTTTSPTTAPPTSAEPTTAPASTAPTTTTTTTIDPYVPGAPPPGVDC